MGFIKAWENAVDLCVAITLYVICPLIVLAFIVLFFPIGLILGLVWLYIVYKHRTPQRNAMNAAKVKQ
jgi:hypothetical protein